MSGAIGDAYSNMVSSAVFETPSAQGSFYVQRSCRRMLELALKYQITGTASYGTAARNMLMTAVGYLSPNSNSSFLYSTYASAVAVTYDMVWDTMTASQRSQVVSHLEAWVTALRYGSNPVGSYTSYQAAVDNYSFSWCTGIAMSLMAIEGESSYPNLQGLITESLQKIHNGWRDAVSPDGSIDENYGYANYGLLSAINAAIASENCGYGDILAGTNLLRTPRWFASSLHEDTFLWAGDSSPSHKGTRLDPVILAIVNRTGDGVGLWGLNRIFAVDPPSYYTPCYGWSPFVNVFLHYPETVTEVVPTVLSGFFRDNLNQGSATSNKMTAYYDVGEGGHAIMHNSTNPACAKMMAYYLIRDEWMNHSHEDDGHFSLGVDGGFQFLDVGYSGPSYVGAQSTDHNIVVVAGEAGYGGNLNNYYNPPSSTSARFMGKAEDVFISSAMDYVRGSHEHMWMMNQADRTVIMVKDDLLPYTILIDRVNKDGSVKTYQQLFHSAGPAYGAGTAASPMTVTGVGGTLRSVWLSPSSVNVVQGSTTNNAGITYFRNCVEATGTDVSFMSIHGAVAPNQVDALQSPLATTVGGIAHWGSHSDRILSRRSGSTLGDAETNSDGRFVWIRSDSSGQLSAWSAAEASSLNYFSTALLSSNQTINVVVRDGKVEIGGADAATLVASLFVPFTVNSVLIDGTSVAFTQSGTQVDIGSTPTGGGFVLPTAGVADRAYSFLGGEFQDANPSFNAQVLGSEELTSSGGMASLVLKGGDALGSVPFSLALDVAFLSTTGYGEAGFVLSGSNTVNILLSPQSATSTLVDIEVNGSIVGSTSLAKAPLANATRLDLEVCPVENAIRVFDGFGALQSTITVGLSGTYVVEALVTPNAVIDNVTLFQADEDGVTPQGIAFYHTAFGVAGFNVRAPSLLFMQDAAVIHDGLRVDPMAAMEWFLIGQLLEIVSSKYGVNGLLLTTREAGWEFAVPAVHLNGATTGIYIESAAGTPLFGSQ